MLSNYVGVHYMSITTHLLTDQVNRFFLQENLFNMLFLLEDYFVSEIILYFRT